MRSASLSKEEFEELEYIEGARRRGFALAPGDEIAYYRLLDKLEVRKRRELVKTIFEEYEDKVKDDELKLKELSEGTSISTKKEATELFKGSSPNFGKVLERSDPTNWLPEYLQKIRNMAEVDQPIVSSLCGRVFEAQEQAHLFRGG
jgi:hypothetical protein